MSPQRYGLADLDSAGQWVQTDDLGAVWQPKAAEGWTPYRSGRWRWFDALGYTWVSDESWGWLPYHYGRWTKHGDLGWVWAPSSNGVFKPGEVFWMRGARFAAWGPLAPGEDWNPPNVAAQYAGAEPDVRGLSARSAGDRSGGLRRIGRKSRSKPQRSLRRCLRRRFRHRAWMRCGPWFPSMLCAYCPNLRNRRSPLPRELSARRSPL